MPALAEFRALLRELVTVAPRAQARLDAIHRAELARFEDLVQLSLQGSSSDGVVRELLQELTPTRQRVGHSEVSLELEAVRRTSFGGGVELDFEILDRSGPRRRSPRGASPRVASLRLGGHRETHTQRSTLSLEVQVTPSTPRLIPELPA